MVFVWSHAWMSRVLWFISGLLVTVLASTERVPAQRIGIFFDEQATQCSAPIEPFGPSVHAFLVAIPPTDSLVGGAEVRLVLPPGIVAGSVSYPHDHVLSAEGDLLTGVTIRLYNCATPGAPIVLALMDFEDRGSVQRDDIVVSLQGVGADSIASMKPQLTICDPIDPTAERGRLEAPSVDATFNCTMHCYCTTAIRPQSWSEMKLLYRE
jgi:hypothetical protein